MLDITPDDIAALSDEDLRTLVGLLAESELRRQELPTSAVTWGGNQTAADGGIDVRVSLSADTSISGFVPRPATGFQVKREDMPRGEILDEMKPQRALRPVIKELAAAKGAYIIVSSQGSTSDAALRHRKEAMSEAIAELPNVADLHLDFYDRTRLATWVREHSGLTPWVRTRIGRPMQGWQSYGGWAFAPVGTEDKYLVDDRLRVKTGKKDDSAGLAATAGIERIRAILSSPRGVARLVGLSGVGKTRFAQALFDEKVGEHSLDASLAIYTNINDGPQPDPVGLATGLIASRSRAILVVDNCAPELHRRLSEVCRTEGSTVSLLTIEYDIREDEPEGTEVFSLEASSPELIVKLLKHRYPDLSGVDAQTIADFSGGNARIAIALADTVGKNETLAGLKEEELFARLLRQRHEHDEALLRAAQAVALVYSFDGETVEGPDCELARLGQLVGLKAEEVFAKVAELRRRDLVQKRSHWRAVLPHAVANRLAELALQNIPRSQIEKQIGSGAPERLRKSLSRRLGWLEKSKEGKAIIESWLAPDGILGNVAALDGTGEAMLRNIAPVEPERVLAAIEHALAGANGDALARLEHKYSRLVRSIAFDPALFERAANILAAMTKAAAGQERDSALRLFTSLFYLYLSGTHATIHQRLKVIESLFKSEDETDRDLAVHALKAVLEATYFSSTYSFEFGARSRDFGYRPKTREDIAEWYGAGIRLLETLLATGRDTERLEAVFAEKFKELWVRVGAYDDLERMATTIASKGFWREGWIEVLRTKRQTEDKLPPEVAERISRLETSLRPANLVQKVRVIVLSRKLRGVSEKDFTDLDDEGDGITIYERAERLAVELGRQLAADSTAFDELLPELVSGKGRLVSLGKGLTRQKKAGALWSRLVNQVAATSPDQKNVAVLLGMLAGFRERSSMEANSYLDEALTDETLAEWFPLLQTAVAIDAAGVTRLRKSLELGKAPIDMYRVPRQHSPDSLS